jgi:cellulose synthase/poly-beta-1,6-N-acetylglucosamine synthase-like glycosyltransferase
MAPVHQLNSPDLAPKRNKITVGVCATGKAENLPVLLDLLCVESSDSFDICKIIIVASGCHASSLERAKRIAETDKRFTIIEEKQRFGKAEAINKILAQREGDFLVFINSDALPEKGALEGLFRHILSNPLVGVVSASPFFNNESTSFLMPMMDELIWSIHNESSLELNHMGVSNHTSDEMMIVKSDLLERLPDDLINDGAFMASKIKEKGFSVGFSKTAKVRISVPTRAVDLITQRRRILFGHFQICGLIGKTPLTVESMLLRSPSVSFGIVAKTIARRPRLMIALPMALITEGLSTFLALIDVTRSSKRHVVWKRYEN